MTEFDEPSPPPAPRGLKTGGIVAAALAVIVVIAGTASRWHETAGSRQWSEAEAIPTVRVIHPTAAAGSQQLDLPGTLAAWDSAHIYARVSGYIRAWYRDIGAPVTRGTPLGAIDTPELDQQIIEARAALGRAQAEAALARTTAARWNDLLKTASVSQQEADEKNGAALTRRAAVREAEAALGRLRAMKAYAIVRSPFSGIVTARSTDIGDLVGPGASNQQPMFSIADESRLRLYVDVPQQYAAQMRRGLTVSLTVPEWPGRRFSAALVGASGAIDSRNGSLQIELVTPNPDHALRSGAYAQVHFTIPGDASTVTIPASALVLRAKGSRVATIGPDGRAHLLAVTIGHDFGPTLEITSGITAQTPLIDNPPDSLTEGEPVKVAKTRG